MRHKRRGYRTKPRGRRKYMSNRRRASSKRKYYVVDRGGIRL